MDLLRTKIIDWTNKDQVLNAVKGNKDALQYATYFHDDKDVVLAAVKCNGLQIKYASPRLKNDPEVVMEAVKNNGEALGLVDNKFAKTKRFMLEALKTAPYAFMLDDNLISYAIDNNLIDKNDYTIIVKNNFFISKIKSYYTSIKISEQNSNVMLPTNNCDDQVNLEIGKLISYLNCIRCNNLSEFYAMLQDYLDNSKNKNDTIVGTPNIKDLL